MGMVGCFMAVTASDFKRMQGDPEFVEEILNSEESMEGDAMMDVDKAWHGIHFLLTGEAWGGEAPWSLAIMGGKEIGEDQGYGPARYLTPEQVITVSHALDSLPLDDFKSRFDPARMTGLTIYPDIWEREGAEALEYVVSHYEGLIKYYRDAASRGDAILQILC